MSAAALGSSPDRVSSPAVVSTTSTWLRTFDPARPPAMNTGRPTASAPAGRKLWRRSIGPPSPPTKMRALVPNGAAAASWVATARVPALATVSLTGKKRVATADELPPIKPPSSRNVGPSTITWARLTGVLRPLTMALIDSVGGAAGAVGATAVGDGEAGGLAG